MLTLIVLAFIVLPVIAGMMKLAMRVLGWTLRVAITVALFPLWIVVAVVCGLAFALRWALPALLVVFLVSLFVPEF